MAKLSVGEKAHLKIERIEIELVDGQPLLRGLTLSHHIKEVKGFSKDRRVTTVNSIGELPKELKDEVQQIEEGVRRFLKGTKK